MWIINIAIQIKNHTVMTALCAIINLIISMEGHRMTLCRCRWMRVMGGKVVYNTASWSKNMPSTLLVQYMKTDDFAHIHESASSVTDC